MQGHFDAVGALLGILAGTLVRASVRFDSPPQHQQFPQIPDCLSLLMALTLTHLRCPLAETSHATMHMPCTGCADGHVCSVKNRCCCGSAAFAATSARTCAHKVWYTTHQVRSTVLQRLWHCRHIYLCLPRAEPCCTT